MEKKDETSAVEIEGLKTIGRIFLAIKARIEPKETASLKLEETLLAQRLLAQIMVRILREKAAKTHENE